MLAAVVKKAATSVPGALKLTAEEREKTAEAILNAIRDSGIKLTREEARKIVEEIAAKPQEVRSSLEQLDAAFAGVRVALE